MNRRSNLQAAANYSQQAVNLQELELRIESTNDFDDQEKRLLRIELCRTCNILTAAMNKSERDHLLMDLNVAIAGVIDKKVKDFQQRASNCLS